jgi:hypothetical protein
MRPRSHTKHTDLFLLRIWTGPAIDGSDDEHWHGVVQRTVDGETHRFRDWQGLLNWLTMMLRVGQINEDMLAPPGSGPESQDTIPERSVQ